MSVWFLDLPGITGSESVSKQTLAAWPDRAMDDRLHHLRVCPVVSSELYQIARHLPVTVVDQADGPMVMVDLRTEVLRQPAFDSDGRFQRSYRPAVTRLLPFCTSAQGALLRLSDEMAPPGPERPAELQQQVAQMLRAQAAGLGRLAEAAGLLINEGLLQRSAEGDLVEWRPLPAEQDGAATAANLAPRPESFLALRLLAVMEFSAMHRREDRGRRPNPDSLRGLLSRNEALRRRVFLTRDEMLDFSALTAGPPHNHKA